MKTLQFAILGFALLALCNCAGDKGKDGESIVGPKGAQGEQGEAGVAGPQGLPGQVGPQGQAGQDATPVTVVKLCPGATTYPGTYVEVAFCLGGKLYGTYSANGGFSTELPPGAYHSDGINNVCEFTVGPNCQVTN